MAEHEAQGLVDASVFNPLPVGARDLLPAAAKRRRTVTASLLAGFERWGYREVVPPLIEYFEVLGRGLGLDDRERCVRFIEAGTGSLVALRSDVTPQIARMVAQRVGGSVRADDGLRLCYAATLVRLPSGRHDRAELHQVGLEYVGDADATADAELIGLCDEALVDLGLTEHRFDLSHSAVVRDALTQLGVAAGVERELLEHLARKDRDGLARVLARRDVAIAVTAEQARSFAALAELHGPPELLDRARADMQALGAGPALDRLREVVATVEREHPRAAARLLVDLGEVRGFDYYTGVRLRVWAPGVGGPIVRGGRYDDLVGRYGAELPATGLAIDLDALEQALAHAGIELAGAALAPARLVAIRTADPPASLREDLRDEAVREAARARTDGLRAWIDTEPSLAQAQAQAQRRHAEQLTWLYVEGRDGAVVRQRWRRTAQTGNWQRESEDTMNDRGQQS